MEPISTFLTVALGYILKGASQSKTADAAKEEVLGRFWQWIRPKVMKVLPEVEDAPDAPETEEKGGAALLEMVRDKDFFDELVKQVTDLENAGVKAKNIVHGDIRRVRIIRIGDKEYSPDESFDRKNIVEGNVEDADSFVLGDGH